MIAYFNDNMKEGVPMICKWDIGGRCNGKTARLIKRAAAENLYIITSNAERARSIFKTAQAMGLNILYPISISEASFKMRGNAYRMTHDGVLVDDADHVLHAVIGMPVMGATATGELVNGE